MEKLSTLLQNVSYTLLHGTEDRMIPAIANNTDKITKGCLFLCIRGMKYDSHEHIEEIIEKGASVLVVEHPVECPEHGDVTIILVEETRYAMAWISAAWFHYPANQMKIIGITGTKGKTTTTYLIKSILEQAGFTVGLIGTIEVIIKDRHIPANNTTPESFLLQQYFSEMLKAGCDIVVMEVSSQGLMLHRTQGFVFELGIFTNLSPDHIGEGEHASFEEYIACKSLLFRQCRIGIVNGDDGNWKRVTKGHTCTLETIGLNPENDLSAADIEYVKRPGELGVLFQTKGLVSMKAEIASPGKFSVYNGLMAIAVCRHFQVKEEVIRKALLLAKVKGRIEMVKVSPEFTVLIDYAHNAMSLESLLLSLKEYEPKRLVCLFGCGGNRSKIRRYEMGEVSGRLADFTIITSDNPRMEKPVEIMADIETGIRKTKGEYILIQDRREAIAYALSHGLPGDVIVLAGKGHEDYQEIEGKKYPMDERQIIAEYLKTH